MTFTDASYIITIHWDESHTSPPIGPYTRAEAGREATAIRKKLRMVGRYRQGCVQVTVLRPPGAWRGWLFL